MKNKNKLVHTVALGITVLALQSINIANAAETLPEVVEGAYEVLDAVNLYDGEAPGMDDWPGVLGTPVEEVALNNGEAIFNIVNPTYTAFLPDESRNTGTAVIIAPGGGFRQLSINGEGNHVATWLAERGIAAFVVKYRLVQLPETELSMMGRMGEISMGVSGEPGVADGLRAMELIRSRASEYRIDPNKVVAIGFSAGAHVVSHMGLNPDLNARANYVAPIYGAPFDDEMPRIPASDAEDSLPPIFLAVAQDDFLVGEVVRTFYTELLAKGYMPDAHFFMSGNHGFGMNQRGLTSDHFIDEFFWWMKAQGLTQKPGDPEVNTQSQMNLGAMQ